MINFITLNIYIDHSKNYQRYFEPRYYTSKPLHNITQWEKLVL